MLAIFLAAAAGASPSPSPGPTTPPDAAVIVNGGSTNTARYRITVRPDGSARIEVEGQPAQTKTVAKANASALFSDLHSAMPLAEIAIEPCVKSASFGTTLHVEYKGTRTPDLSCSNDKAAARLSADIAKITQELNIQVMRRYGGVRSTHITAEPKPTST
jgi:hypothetical protein